MAFAKVLSSSTSFGFRQAVASICHSRMASSDAQANFNLFDSAQDSPSPQPQRRFANRGINRVELLGGVAGVPSVKVTAQGSAFASFNLYTNVDRKVNNGGTITSTEVHNVVAFGGMARYVEKTITKGMRVYLTGRLHYTGGQMMPDGSRTPRICSINLESMYPLARGGGGGMAMSGVPESGPEA